MSTGLLDPEIARDTHVPNPATIGKSIRIRGEVKGAEPLCIAGKVEGSIDVSGHQITVEASGVVASNISAGAVVVKGTVRGNVKVSDRVEICDTGSLTGDVEAKRIRIEDKAHIKGKVEISRSDVTPIAGTEKAPHQYH